MPVPYAHLRRVLAALHRMESVEPQGRHRVSVAVDNELMTLSELVPDLDCVPILVHLAQDGFVAYQSTPLSMLVMRIRFEAFFSVQLTTPGRLRALQAFEDEGRALVRATNGGAA